MKNKTITKHYLEPKGISYSIIPLDRPSLAEWLKEFNAPINKIKTKKI